MQAADTVTVQQGNTNTFISITKKIRNVFPIKKGDVLILKVIDGKIIIERPEEE